MFHLVHGSIVPIEASYPASRRLTPAEEQRLKLAPLPSGIHREVDLQSRRIFRVRPVTLRAMFLSQETLWRAEEHGFAGNRSS